MKSYVFLVLGLLLSFGSLAQDLDIPQVQHSIVTKRTATWCPICGGEAWDMMKRMQENLKTDALVINAHHSSLSNLYSVTAQAWIDNFQTSFGQPVFFYNEERIGSGSQSTENAIINKVKAASGEVPRAQSILEIQFDAGQSLLQADVATRFFNNTSGDFYLGVYLIRKSVIEIQSNRAADANHQNVLWGSITDNAFGELLVEGSVGPANLLTQTFQFTLPKELELDNLRFATVLWEKKDGVYYIVNTNWTDNATLATITKVRQPQGVREMQLMPVLANGQTTIQLRLTQVLDNASIQLFDLNGRLVKTIFQGRLPAGEHRIPITLLYSGTYFVRLQSGDRLVSRKLINR